MQEPMFFTTENIHGPACIESRKPIFFLITGSYLQFCPSAKMRASGLVKGMDVGPFPPLHWLIQNRFKTNKQFFLGKKVVQSHKQAISHFCRVQLAPKFQTAKNTHKQVGRGAPGTHTPLLTQSRAPSSFRGQFPSLNRK